MSASTQAVSSSKPDRLVLSIGATIGMCIVGDSLLYNILPLEAEHLGIAPALVGVLLSANRLVRLVSNTWVSAIFERLGPRWPFVAATVLSLVTTLLYGTGWGFLVFLLARAGWGIAWSGLRQGGYQAIWTGPENSRGRLMGLLWGVVRVGSAISVLVGGYLRDRFDYRVSVFAVACLTALAIPTALAIRWPEAQAVVVRQQNLLKDWPMAFRTAPRRWLLVAGALYSMLEGVVISTASLFLATRLGASDLSFGLGIKVGTIAGLLLAVRWMSDLLLGPAAGALSDHWGRPFTALLLAGIILAGIVGTVTLPGWLPVLCLSLTLIASGGLNITLNTIGNGVAANSERPHLFVGVYATAIDAGLAVGPLLAFSVGRIAGLDIFYVVFSSLLFLAVWLYRRSEQSAAH